MKEKYESLSLATLKDLAKARGLKGISTMRKPELIERMLEEDRKEQTAENKQKCSRLLPLMVAESTDAFSGSHCHFAEPASSCPV